LTETFINVFDTDSKHKYANDVWDIIQSSYAKIGVIHGSGFYNKQDMINNIPFWKLAKKDGKIVAVALYKDKQSRKRIAAGTDGSDDGKRAFADIATNDLSQNRSYSELSGPSLSFVKRRYTNDIKKYMIPPSEVENMIGDKITYPVNADDQELQTHPEFKDYFYSRIIGGQPHTKLMIGTPKKKIY
jgi:hypothetical protein